MKRLLSAVLAIITVLAIVSTTAGAASPRGTRTESFPRLSVDYPDTVYVNPGETVTVPVELRIETDWHINSNDPIQDYLIPTTVTVEDSDVRSRKVDYPAGEAFNFSFSKTRVLVYSDRVTLPVTVSVPEASALKLGFSPRPVKFLLRYQACSDTKCARPVNAPFTVDFLIEGSRASSGETEPFRVNDGGVVAGASRTNRIEDNFQENGLVLGLGFVFVLGLMLNLTPCVYPMIPITVGYFGNKEGGQLSSRVLDAVMFVVGMALIYSIFGTLAGMTDNVLGQALQQPFLLVTLSGVMVLLAASMFGLYELKVPASVRRGSERIGRGLGTFGMGMTLGVAAAPCLAPATVTLLAYVSQQGDAYMGGLLFFVLSLGLGFPYLFLAVFASSLSDLPGSGNWLDWVNKLLGFMILGVAIYFLWPLMSLKLFGYLLIALAVVGGLVLAVMHPPSNNRLYYARAAGIAFLVVVFIAYADRTLLVAYEGINWLPAEKVMTKSATNLPAGPTLVYVGADWCAPCQELKVQTFSDQALRRTLQPVTPVKIDLTNEPSEAVNDWLSRMNVNGVPMLLFLKSDGREIRSLRTAGFVGPTVLINKVQVLKRRSKDSS